MGQTGLKRGTEAEGAKNAEQPEFCDQKILKGVCRHF
jgi:hypothetical protein